ESVEDMGLYEEVSDTGSSLQVTVTPTAWITTIVFSVFPQPQGQAAQDVEKAVSLFESTGRISATVMEAR
ncbi:hypothetical protein GOODEAATRI_029395, partial [Goodea atripinnis]